MQPDAGQFELSFKQQKIQVQRHAIGGQTIFRIIFPNSTAPLVITKAKHSDTHFFWTSIPEGRLKEAGEIGLLIEEYYKKSN